MPNVTHHQRNANGNHNEISPHTCQNGHHQYIIEQQVLVRIKKKEPFLHCGWECRLVQPLWKAVWRYIKKIKNGTALWPSDSASGNLSKETQNANSKEHKHPCVHCSIIYNPQDMEAAQVPISRWVDKTTMGHLHNGRLLGHKKEEKFTLCDSIDGPGEQCSNLIPLATNHTPPG